MEKDSCLIQVTLPDESLLILTRAEFERARRRGDSVLRNHFLRRKGLGEEIIEAMEVRDA